MTLNACINNFEFFLIYEQEGLRDPVDGVLGLSRNKPFFLSRGQGTNRGPSYLMAMENSNLISERSFSFSMSPFGSDSHLDFGAPQNSRMRDPSELTWISLNDDYFWSAHCQGFALGSPDNSWAWGSVKGQTDTIDGGEVYSIFDTGSSAIIFPKYYFEGVLFEIFKEMGGDEYEVADGYVISKCYDDFPMLYFLFNTNWVAVDPADYVIDISEQQDKSICVLLLSQSDAAFFVMGLPVYMDYYTVHDDTKGLIGFAPRAGSTKEKLRSGLRPDRYLVSSDPAEAPMSFWSWVISSVLVMSFMCCWLQLFVRTQSSSRRDKVDPAQFCCVAISFILAFATVIYFKLQPIINEWIIDDAEYYG